MLRDELKKEAEEYIEYLNNDYMIVLEDSDKIDGIIELLNEEKLDLIVRNKLIEETKKALTRGVKENGILLLGFAPNILDLCDGLDENGNIIKEFIENEEIDSGFRDYIAGTQSKEYIEELLIAGRVNFGKYYYLTRALGRDKIMELIESEKISPEVKMKLARGYIDFDSFAKEDIIKIMQIEGSGEEFIEQRKEFALRIHNEELSNRYVKIIKNVSELNVEELEKMPEIVAVTIKDFDTTRIDSSYSKETYIAIRKVIDEKILAGIEKPIKGDFESEFKAFSEICSRLSEHIKFDYEADGMIYVGERNEAVTKSQNLYGLLLGESVCAGYSEILRNVLSCVDIDCRYISGDPKIEKNKSRLDSESHAWNQVNIGGHWFNVDLTWERDKIVRNNGEVPVSILKSDKEFKDHDIYSRGRPHYEEKCSYSVILGKEIESTNDSIEEKTEKETLKTIVEKGAKIFKIIPEEIKNTFRSLLKPKNHSNKHEQTKDDNRNEE